MCTCTVQYLSSSTRSVLTVMSCPRMSIEASRSLHCNRSSDSLVWFLAASINSPINIKICNKKLSSKVNLISVFGQFISSCWVNFISLILPSNATVYSSRIVWPETQVMAFGKLKLNIHCWVVLLLFTEMAHCYLKTRYPLDILNILSTEGKSKKFSLKTYET